MDKIISNKEKVYIRNNALIEAADELLESSTISKMLINHKNVIELARKNHKIIEYNIVIGEKLFNSNSSNKVVEIKELINDYKKEHKRRIKYYSDYSKNKIAELEKELSSSLNLNASEYFNIKDREIEINIIEKRLKSWNEEKDRKIKDINFLRNKLNNQSMKIKHLEEEIKLKTERISFYEYRLRSFEGE